MDSNQDIKSVKLNGFAPASGSGAGSSASSTANATGPTASSSSSSAAASAAAAASSIVAGGSAGGGGGGGTLTSAAKKPPVSKAKRAKAKKKSNGGASTASSSASSSDANNDNNNHDGEETALRPLSDVGSDFAPLSLPQIQLRLKSMLEKLPRVLPDVPPPYDANNNDGDANAANLQKQYAPVKSFASALQILVEEYNLILSLVSAATYEWGVDRSGASQQNLSVMSAELQQCQEVISNVVSARLSNVLCPAVDVMVGEVEVRRGGGGDDDVARGDGGDGGTTRASGRTPKKRRLLNQDKLATNNATSNENGVERRINHYVRPLVDPSYVHLCHCILARNASLIRHTVATSVHTAQRVIGDYSKAMKKDSSHDSGKGGYY